MNSHESWRFQQPSETSMSSSVATMSEVARGLVRREQQRSGDPAAARASVARRLRLGPGSLGNLLRERIKAIRADVSARIVAAAVADLQNEIMRLEHELDILRRMGASPSADDFREVEAAIEVARLAMAKVAK